MPATQYAIAKRSENSPAIKKLCTPQEGHCEKKISHEIQGDSQEMTVMVG